MSFEIAFVTSDEQYDEVFRLRHEVLVDEEGYLSAQPGGRVVDAFDTKTMGKARCCNCFEIGSTGCWKI